MGKLHCREAVDTFGVLLDPVGSPVGSQPLLCYLNLGRRRIGGVACGCELAFGGLQSSALVVQRGLMRKEFVQRGTKAAWLTNDWDNGICELGARHTVSIITARRDPG